MPAVIKVMKDEATLITLVKPQFEARRSQVRSLPFIDEHILQEICNRGYLSLLLFIHQTGRTLET